MNLATKEYTELANVQTLVAIKQKKLKDSLAARTNPYWLARNFNLIYRNPFQWRIKRIIDVVASTVGLIILAPILLLVAAAIKLDSQGPVFFKQRRIGLYGKPFYIYKFRSMAQDAEKNFEQVKEFNESNNIMFKMADDPRITKVGKIIRKYSLDEFPQLFNVLRGEMSLVGPRPPLPKEVILYQRWHYLRFAIMPGITGLWQVSGRASIVDFDKVVKLDYKYATNWSLGLDLKLLIKTIPVVLLAKGAS